MYKYKCFPNWGQQPVTAFLQALVHSFLGIFSSLLITFVSPPQVLPSGTRRPSARGYAWTTECPESHRRHHQARDRSHQRRNRRSKSRVPAADLRPRSAAATRLRTFARAVHAGLRSRNWSTTLDPRSRTRRVSWLLNRNLLVSWKYHWWKGSLKDVLQEFIAKFEHNSWCFGLTVWART